MPLLLVLADMTLLLEKVVWMIVIFNNKDKLVMVFCVVVIILLWDANDGENNDNIISIQKLADKSDNNHNENGDSEMISI